MLGDAMRFILSAYWRHHITLAYLAATDDNWKARMFGLIDEKMHYFFKYSKGGVMIDEHHWMHRPRWCNHYRNVKLRDPDGGAHDFNHVSIIRFFWEEAQHLANTEPSSLRQKTSGATPTAVV